MNTLFGHKLHLKCMTIVLIFCIVRIHSTNSEDFCFKNEQNCSLSSKRYLLYDVNRPEGFNLRRDVYMRLAVLAHKMRQSSNSELNSFSLVLPPWSHLIHWTYRDYPEQIPWGLYFDIESLKKFAPVIEMYEFFDIYPNKYTKVVIDEVYNLQHFEDMFETGNFEERMNIEKCQRTYDKTYLFYKNITAKDVKCLSYHGPATKLTELFVNTSAKIILLNHAEVTLHDFFGSKVYWEARRSMRFSKELKLIANEFRKTVLNSTDASDNTLLPEIWTDEKPKRNAIGGPYVGIHLRRRDFVRSRPTEAPSLEKAADQIKKVLNNLDLKTVFVATDGTQEEFNDLASFLQGYNVVKYRAPSKIEKKYKDGGLAIIDQIICSYARYFIGTHESTFSFRIQEEREILGFPVDTTYNVFCTSSGCQKPSVWEIVY
ncbi:GDP-fucose protein O-fucosyltransferase 2-like [Diabrotica undecimpunctata]|uniref:GDP-fucose protein O-fucosyltransferase 2-like n=1 Tax=Diabrotica undecimpunctata TaxID=50387 RepID=UPI003B63DC21